MYVPEHFREDDLATLHATIRELGFGVLVSSGPEGLFASHIPFLLDSSRGERGTLVGHVARANQHWQFMADREALAIFQGPHAYITPSWYTTPIAVPTWNYQVVHARGRPRLVDEARLRQILDETVATFEARFSYAWTPPEGDLVDTLMRHIVGFEIEIDRIDGKSKLSQNRSRADREGTIAGLRDQGDPAGLDIARLMEERL